MPAYEINILPTHNEVTILGRFNRDLVTTIMGELSKTRDFPRRNAIWVFTEKAESPSFDEFEGIVAELQPYLLPGLVDKRVGLVSASAVTNSFLQLWRSAATELPVKLEVFRNYDNALDWVTP